ncbi:hypothetical protein EJ04DRAFT_536684 [Polyplosphaeria fusca]|uniref:Uncharacterized protein n=1 Tax=Polyplosphaeria fusca TaxID=682080 RepID=A0A9P4UWT5_9PLEO|nr:hypothetical protein EJ04DRAFT_536684 [Polyplosphaeria fusca]
MAFTVEKANESDIDKIVSIMFESYGGTNAYINAAFPRGFTKEGHEINKAVDSETGEIVGGAMLRLYQTEKPPPLEMDGPPGTWETEDEKRYAQALQRSFAEDESKLWAENELPLLGMSEMERSLSLH